VKFDSTIGLEETQRAALVRLFRHLNSAIVERQALKETEDVALADFLGRAYVPVELEQIDPENFYEGHRPSLIRAPINKYPNVAVWAVRATPHPESARSDHTDIFNVLLFVEIMCKSIDDEETVNKRTVRTVEAVNAVMTDDKTLGGVVTGFDDDVSPSMSDVFTRKEKTTYGDLWFWQGARLEYVVRKDAIRYLPSGSSSAQDEFFKSLPDGMTPADWAALDQS
jgi:small nuclear ribonucleoprotein (snRNP)-like protein